MTSQPPTDFPVPDETSRVAKAAYTKSNRYLRLHDEMGQLYVDTDIAAIFLRRGQPAHSPTQFALIRVMQVVDGLTDREAAAAVAGCIDSTYALRLELSDPGFDASVLSEFRDHLRTRDAEALLLERLLIRCQEASLLRAGGRQPPRPTPT